MSINLLAFRSGVAPTLVLIPTYINLINGAISGAIAGFATNPFDVLKTRLMLQQQQTSKEAVYDCNEQDVQGK